MKYILSIDEGTSSTRAMVYTTQGRMVCMSQQPITHHYPSSGWVELDPEEIWTKTLAVIQEVVSKVDVSNIISCGITNQRETLLVWDKKTGRCVYPAIVWQDRRTEVFCQSLQPYKDLIKQKTGLLPDPYFSASKLHWLMTNIPEVHELCDTGQLAAGTVDSFLLWRLTKGKSHLTDITNASRTLLFNIITRQWDEELLKLFSLTNNNMLPGVRASDAYFGTIEQAFFGAAIPITGIAGDQQAALIGQHCFDKGMVKATYGTGGFLLMNTGEHAVFSEHGLLTTIAYQTKDVLAYGLEGSLYHAGTVIKWLRDEMGLLKSAQESQHLAESITDNEGVYLIPSFTGLGAPHWISTTGAMVVGLSRKSHRAHFARAALESVAYQTRDVLACMQEDSEIVSSVLRVDGGMSANNWLIQFLASQCDVTVQRPVDIETTARGAAMLSILGCGEASSLSAMQVIWEVGSEFQPEGNGQERERHYQGWLHALRMAVS